MKSTVTMVGALCLLAMLVAFAPTVSGWCLDDTDHDLYTRRTIDCSKNHDAGETQEGCQKLCYAQSWCKGVVWIPKKAYWVGGKYCCYLKNKYSTSALKPEKNYRYCMRGY
eukprot:TRINITY_DN2155_c0_g1_i7.p1 TRINITY_DN2155_c0_g1~~TRINITY_DN2155_c0_g1_i7.p1  ORF type:complete len:111 (-),score=11.05 TRINITY_DN2155_c0_g1_i7:868-1200(-)